MSNLSGICGFPLLLLCRFYTFFEFKQVAFLNCLIKKINEIRRIFLFEFRFFFIRHIKHAKEVYFIIKYYNKPSYMLGLSNWIFNY